MKEISSRNANPLEIEENMRAEKHLGAEPKNRRPPHQDKLNAAGRLAGATTTNTDSSNFADIDGPKGGDLARSSSPSKSDVNLFF
jgi:hypothetical protein